MPRLSRAVGLALRSAERSRGAAAAGAGCGSGVGGGGTVRGKKRGEASGLPFSPHNAHSDSDRLVPFAGRWPRQTTETVAGAVVVGCSRWWSRWGRTGSRGEGSPRHAPSHGSGPIHGAIRSLDAFTPPRRHDRREGERDRRRSRSRSPGRKRLVMEGPSARLVKMYLTDTLKVRG